MPEEIYTERLRLLPMTLGELRRLSEKYRDDAPELSRAYGEMLDSCERHPESFLWYTPWKLCRRGDGAVVGCAGFKGLWEDGRVEIGYGIDKEHEGNGYAAEGAAALCRWAFSTGRAAYVEAETAPDNIASQRVLEKIGFKAAGRTGGEGPVFILTSADRP